jgi:hypothetical protein
LGNGNACGTGHLKHEAIAVFLSPKLCKETDIKSVSSCQTFLIFLWKKSEMAVSESEGPAARPKRRLTKGPGNQCRELRFVKLFLIAICSLTNQTIK